ncbi:peptidoglycan recognition protein family protein [Micromonospora globbae]|uniref:peptidoglycan recognition protein family protein n=1 Tax=Micromonospora globbae TaxID=1894969 RepID=UPI00342181F5
MTLPWLADVLRDAGLVVIEHGNWRKHVRPGDWSPQFGVVHATAAPRTQSDSVQIAVVRDGRADLPGPIANAVVDRLGRWHVVSAGRCNSTLVGTAGPFRGKGNTYALSTEACNDNRSEPWPEVQYRSYVRGWAAWCRPLGWTASKLVGHKEHTPGRKTDPTFSMSRFRADVAAVLAGEDDDMTEEDRKLLRAVHADVRKILTGNLATYESGAPENALIWWIRMLANTADPALRKGAYAKFPPPPAPGLAQIGTQLAALRTDVAALAGRDLVDEAQLADLLAPQLVAAVVSQLPDNIADLTRDQLVTAVEDGVRAAFAGGLAPDTTS